MSTSWYIARGDKQHGPISENEFAEILKNDHLLPSDSVWREGLPNWVSATEFLREHNRRADGPLDLTTEQNAPVQNAADGTKSRRWVTGPRVVVVLVALFLGFIAWQEPRSIAYRVGAGLNGAFFGAIGGGLGALLSALIERFFSRTIPHRWKIGAASVGFLLGAGFGKMSEVGLGLGIDHVRDATYLGYVRPKIDAARIRRVLREGGEAGRLYRLVEEREPATFDAIVQVVVANARTDATQDQLINLMREQFIERISKPRMRYLADNDLLVAFTLSADMVRELAQTNPRLCVAMMQGKPFGDLRPFVSAEIAQRERALMERMITVAPRQFSLLPAAQLQDINRKIAIELYSIYGVELEVLDPAKQTPGRERAACVMYAEYLKRIFNLPKQEAAALLRALVVDPARLG
jgi:hypothetical protein